MSIGGYLVVLLGVAGWVAGCFLPLFQIADFGGDSTTLYKQVAFGPIGIKLGSALFLFGAIAAIGVISMIGMLRHRRWSATVLTGAAIAWFLTSTGVLISVGSASAALLTGLSPCRGLLVSLGERGLRVGGDGHRPDLVQTTGRGRRWRCSDARGLRQPLDVKVVTVERERTPLLHFVIVGLFILSLLILAFGVMVRP